MFETMAVWETPEVLPSLIPPILEFVSIWQAAEKIVYATTLQAVSTARTRLARKLKADVVPELKVSAHPDPTRGKACFA